MERYDVIRKDLLRFFCDATLKLPLDGLTTSDQRTTGDCLQIIVKRVVAVHLIAKRLGHDLGMVDEFLKKVSIQLPALKEHLHDTTFNLAISWMYSFVPSRL